MILNFHKQVRWLTLFLAGFCVALLVGVVSLSQSATAVDRLPTTVDSAAYQATVPTTPSAYEAAATHQESNFYQ